MEKQIRNISIVGIFGKHNELGEGKTILLTYGAKEESDKGEKVFADYTLPFAEKFNHVSEWNEIYNSTICLDDAITFFDCRKGMQNIDETWILNQLRKHGNNLYWTSQYAEGIELRLRLISNFLYETELIRFPEFRIQKLDKTGTPIDKPINRTYGKDILDIYNTLEQVKRKVKLEQLEDYFTRYNQRVAFRLICKQKFSFKTNVSDVIWYALDSNTGDRAIKDISEMLSPLGYELVID